MELFVNKAKEKRRKIVVCEAWDGRPLKAVDKLLKHGVADFILLEENGNVRKKAEELGVDISKCEIVDYKDEKLMSELAEGLFELRKHKGVDLEKAKEMIKDVNYFGCMMVVKGMADAVVSSCICPTSDIMRPALQLIKTKDGIKTVSEITAMVDKKNDKLIFFTDGSINIAPTPEQRADIVFNAVNVVKGLGFDPKVALLSHSTHGSGEHPVLEPIRETLKICKERDSSLVIDGEMQADAALSPDAAVKKADDLVVKGDANVLVFPEIMAGNIVGHLLMQLTDNEFYVIIAGMKHPVGVFGRSTPWELQADTMTIIAAQCNM